MSYIREIGEKEIGIGCASNPEATYAQYYSDIEKKIKEDGYVPKTLMEI